MWVNAFLQRETFQILGPKMTVFLSPFANLTPRPHHTLIVCEPGEVWGGGSELGCVPVLLDGTCTLSGCGSEHS